MDAKNQRNSVLADALFERNCRGVHGENIDGAGRHEPHRARSRSNARLQAAMGLRPIIGRATGSAILPCEEGGVVDRDLKQADDPCRVIEIVARAGQLYATLWETPYCDCTRYSKSAYAVPA